MLMQNKLGFFTKPFAMVLVIWGVTLGRCSEETPARTPQESFVLWQLPSQTPTQMMSYVMRTPDGKVIVIDGGNTGDAAFLAGFLRPLGNVVEAWFISHPHSDHIDALTEILREPGDLKIHAIYGSLPTLDWVSKHESDADAKKMQRFEAALVQSKRAVAELSIGQMLEIDGVHVEVLSVKNPEITRNALNNSSVVLRVWDSVKSVLFLGDLGVEGGEKLLKSSSADRLHADYVQMAHHGQNGVSREFYERVNPTYCLWPTPKWLWDNDKGQGKGSGSWRTLEVREWLSKLPPQSHFLMWQGLQKIE